MTDDKRLTLTSGIRPAVTERVWRVANGIAIAAAFCTCIATFAQASAKVAGLLSLVTALAMSTTFVIGRIRERASQAELESARRETTKLHERAAPRNLTADQRAALVRAAKVEGAQKIWVPHVANDNEASEYAKQLRDAFTEAGWETGYASFHVATPMYGLVVGMGPPFTNSPEPREIERVRRVLETAGIALTVTEEFPPTSPAFGWSPHPHPGPNAAVLVAASKPLSRQLAG
ncbi:hypothetical protein [Burkholderia cenocepacia]|uniref:hypothetical protein n=1 Tax=Burkholderia cenocepacia TaxID=95486 RepID=UPI002AAFB544|nr:hypothetical protein [Burkholderia cenocepacia]